MSVHDRPDGAEPVLRREIRAHARAERQRIRARLRPGVRAVDELDDPGVGYRVPHHRWHESGRRPAPRWRKRRQQLRRASRRQRSTGD